MVHIKVDSQLPDHVQVAFHGRRGVLCREKLLLPRAQVPVAALRVERVVKADDRILNANEYSPHKTLSFPMTIFMDCFFTH